MAAAPVSVTGADEMLRISKALKAAGATELRKELNKGLRAAGKPLIVAVRESARNTLPRRGGLGTYISKKRARVQVKTGSTPGVSVVFAKQDPRLDDGRLVHPVFGRRPTVVQRVRPGTFSRALEFSAPDIRRSLSDVLEDFSNRLDGLGG